MEEIVMLELVIGIIVRAAIVGVVVVLLNPTIR